MYIFISHSSINADVAGEMCNILEANGTGCFLAPRDIRSGHVYAEEIVNGIDKSDAMLVILSEEANKSPHVLREIERAVSKNIPIIVYKLEEVEITKSLEYFLMTHQWINSTQGDYNDVLKAVEDLQEKVAVNQAAVSNTAEIKLSEIKSLEIKSGTKEKSTKAGKYVVIGIVALILAVALFLIVYFVTDGTSGWENQNESVTDEQQETVESDETERQTESNKETENKSEKQSEQATDNISSNVKLGDTIMLGQYNGVDIAWKVVKISEDGKEAVLITKDIITMKAYDAAESGKYNYDGDTDYWSQDSEANTNMELQAYVRGNSDWESSNIRSWLNGTGEVVEYEGQAPVASAMCELHNGYEFEAGFLSNFTDKELTAIKDTEVMTKGNEISAKSTVTTVDKVFLLSREELKWLKEAGVSMLAVPTDEAIEQDQSKWYNMYSLDYSTKPFIWWLRDPVEKTTSKCYVVGNGLRDENVYGENAGLEGFGIRPAITVDLQSGAIKVAE